jgi:hypothetical protein
VPPKSEAAMPATLDTPAFHAAWSKWLQNLAEKGKPQPTITEIEEEWQHLAKLGEKCAVAAISYSIRRRWLSINEEDSSSKQPPGSQHKSSKEIIAKHQNGGYRR